MRIVDSATSGIWRAVPPRIAIVAALVALELLALSVLYNNAFVFVCRDHAPGAFCGFMSLLVVRAIVLTAVAAVVLYPAAGAVMRILGAARYSREWLWVNLAGFAAIVAPWTFLEDGVGGLMFAASIMLWLGGAAAAAAGAIFAIAEPTRWLAIARLGGPSLALAGVVALASPELTMLFQRLWTVDLVTTVTFAASDMLLRVFAEDVVSVPAEVLLGVPEFMVLVGPQCSGIEGFALITGFMALYLWVFRSDLRFPLVLVLLPLGVLASWVLNVVRITGLILLGAHVSPDLAVNGFHSHAGWLMFTILSLSLATAAHAAPVFRRQRSGPAGAHADAPQPARTLPPLREDWNVARLAPFMVFMATALLASTFSETPGVLYPARFIAMLAALWVFRDLFRALPWRLDAAAVALGFAIGVAWVATSPSPADGEPSPMALALAAMPLWAFAVWAACRALGTTFLVPMIEELLFRSYLQERLNLGGRYGLVFAVLLSTALFAVLHDRWLAAALAGLVFAWVAQRSGRVTDAIVCHAVANGVIAAWALMTGDWAAL